MYSSKIKKDCFAYDKVRNSCKALKELYCRFEDCNFYKTSEQRCRECKSRRTNITCEDCKRNGW